MKASWRSPPLAGTQDQDYRFHLAPENKFPWNLFSGVGQLDLAPNGKFLGNFSFGAKNKFKLFVPEKFDF